MPLPYMLSPNHRVVLCCVCYLCEHVRSDVTARKTYGMVSNNATFVIYTQYIDLCSETAKLELLREERRSLWKAWSDVALIRNWASEEVLSVFATGYTVSQCLHNKTIFYKAIHVQGERST